ncbi:MAG TPA: transcription antitermination factor NusB [Acidimicrobiales bacterium]|nr:transcription antitermination factor NusB [Acidimicrobiales bacterium]
MSTSPAPDPPPAAVGARRRSRERALGLLYEAEAKAITPAELLKELPVAPEHFAAALVSGVSGRLPEIDGLISRFARDWGLDRLPAVDRQLLRLSIYELLDQAEVPVAVVIDEAVELAKQYSTEESSRFVNGVLSAVASEVRPTKAAS